ncbi:Hypothetical protein, putative [Bodo saltans]|uniref:Uncharacterized protein n=1 Tax=Bodo saltans TaxID=75058 RepID=A0A0S4IZ41_BODSA|nr:Hypothetical protein, putative [Bodo saltans]|eukprot:CUG62341.1 Hypothetical protein, putative [Bodo saltans]
MILGEHDESHAYDDEPALFGGPEGITVEHVNWLLKVCNIVQENPMTTLQQCSSSLFVLMVQRLLGFRVPGLQLEPNTFEKKVWNTTRVLEELSVVCGEDLLESYINPEAIVQGDPRQIALLVRVMYHIALHMIREREVAEQQATTDALQPHESNPKNAASSVTNTSKSSLQKNNAKQGEELVSQSPSNDSLAFTKELVAGWDRGVVPPPKRARGALIDPLSITELQQRIQILEQAFQQAGVHGRRSVPRPSGHDSRLHSSLDCAANRNADRKAVAELQNATHAVKTENLRTAKFVDSLQSVFRREVVNKRSCAERDALAAYREAAVTQRRHHAAIARQIRDEDDLIRKAAEALVESERNRLRLNSRLMTEQTAKIVTHNFAAIRETRRVLRDKNSKNATRIKDDVVMLRETVGSWRSYLSLS